MGEKEYKKYDSADKYRMAGVRLAKDAESRDGDHGKMVRLTFVSTSRKEAHSDLWVEANVGDFQAELASFLKKGDILFEVEGKPCLRRYGDDNEKFSFVVDRCSLVIPPDLFAELKERGWEPGAGKPTKGAKTSKPAAKPAAKTAAKPAGKPTKKKPEPIEIPDDDDDIEIEDDDSDGE